MCSMALSQIPRNTNHRLMCNYINNDVHNGEIHILIMEIKYETVGTRTPGRKIRQFLDFRRETSYYNIE